MIKPWAKHFCTTLFTVFYELLLSLRLKYHISVSTFVCCTVKFFSQNMIRSLLTPLMLNKILIANTQLHSLYSATCYQRIFSLLLLNFGFAAFSFLHIPSCDCWSCVFQFFFSVWSSVFQSCIFSRPC